MAATTENEKKQSSRAVLFAKDFIAGTVAGWAQVLSGQPFDTVKVRLQTAVPGQNVYNGPVDAMKKIWSGEGLKGFYKGTTIPMIGVGFCVSVQFAAQTQARKFFAERNKKNGRGDEPLSMMQIAMCGAVAGIANAPLSTPIEHIRIRLQVQTGETLGPFALMKEMVQRHGPLSLFKGWNPTIAREIPGYAFYFLTYEAAIRAFTPKGKTVNDLSTSTLLLCGALSGLGMWLTCYPLDVVKSRIQADHLDPTKARYASSLACYRSIFATEGIRGFYRGLAPCLVRAFPVNAITFLTYELTMRLMGGRDI
jgi:solute carrier family 25 carnitine/acylcarnitine transporter 20/29